MNLLLDLILGKGFPLFPNFMAGFLYWFTAIISLLFILMYFHQVIYLIISVFVHVKIKPKAEVTQHKIGIVVSARNEQNVLPNLIKSIQANDYPKELVTIFVIADNCTDDTAKVCREMGCVVVERNDLEHIGKGFALHYLFTKLHTEEEYAHLVPDAYIVVDADNLLTSNYITEMNKAFDSGYEMVSSYRNSKNFGESWISSGYAYWFLHDSRHLNNGRMFFHNSCAMMGTGFLISTNVVKEFDNWKFFSLTEDVECSVEYALSGKKMGYCSTAEFFDEQPTKFKQSWKQRERWAKGFYQVFAMKGWSLVKSAFTNFSCWDILTSMMPAIFIGLISTITLPICMVISACMGDTANVLLALQSLAFSFLPLYGSMLLIALLTCITEWKRILAHPFKKILYIFTFPIFMASYIPICFVALFKKVKWTPIQHTETISMEEIEAAQKQQAEAHSKDAKQKKEKKSKDKKSSK
ncbi:MAG: glycosyltransferase family 2 protein [Clostridia bacterium]|nr:glycosyltransferase family 2 protein [Clostridia bacterium]